jgi:hypothetical protein
MKAASLWAEFSDPICWRRFFRIPLDGMVPHSTTLMKLTTSATGPRLRQLAVGRARP